VLASGLRLDGSTAGADDPFSAGTLGQSVIKQAAFALIDIGVLDPSAIVDLWLPGQPNADRVTVQMLIDQTTGWTTEYYDSLLVENLLVDLERVWTLAEALDQTATLPPVAEPGVFDPTGWSNDVGLVALAFVVEQVTGSSIADVIAEQVSGPLGLDDTLLSDGNDEPDNSTWGLFVLPGLTESADLRDLPHVGYRTISPDLFASISTVPDLLDLVDAWGSGDYPGGTAPTTAAFVPERQLFDDEGQPGVNPALGLPFNGLCPCEPGGDGVAPRRFGRQPSGIGTQSLMYHHPADDIEVVLHFNSDEDATNADLVAIADEVHDAVLAAIS